MREKFIKIIRRGGTSLSIHIPSEIVELMNLKEGDMLRVDIEKIRK